MSNELSPNLFERHPGRTILVLSLIAFFFIIAGTEIALRLAGYQPGGYNYGRVDRLVVYDNFITDDSGIFKANPRSQMWQPPFAINRDGFRSPDFSAPRDQRPSILLLGDSFAWGGTASPITASFADLLRDSGYVVYNTGIPGVSPTQYEALANTYIPRLHPDFVIVSFYMGNDLREKPDPLIPNHNLYYVTNAGWFRGFDSQNDRPLSAEEAYRNYVDTPKERIKMLLHKISIGTLMYNQVQGYRRRAEPPAKKYLYTIDCLQHIQTMAQTKGSRFYLLVIPDLGKGCECAFRVIDFRPIFDQLDPIYLEGLDDRMYTSSPDCHLNNEGHRYVYEKIIQTLKNSRE